MSLVGTVWIYFRVPELKDRGYLEIDALFTRKISARKFASANLGIAESATEKSEMEKEDSGNREAGDVEMRGMRTCEETSRSAV